MWMFAIASPDADSGVAVARLRPGLVGGALLGVACGLAFAAVYRLILVPRDVPAIRETNYKRHLWAYVVIGLAAKMAIDSASTQVAALLLSAIGTVALVFGLLLPGRGFPQRDRTS